MNGRTTAVDDPTREGRNGRTYLSACLDSHVPLDLVIFMLGTNDLKAKYLPSPEVICQRMRDLVKITKALCSEYSPNGTKILVMVPAIPKRHAIYEDYHYDSLEPFARELVTLYETMSRQEEVYFLDASKHLESSELDGAHFEASVHLNFGEVVFNKMNDIFNN
ncbi:MAG: GDSL-type esterase/lipase family protein [Bdellovibrionota bacterium]